MQTQTILGIGGFPNEAMLDYVLTLARGPRVLWVGTAQPEDAAAPSSGTSGCAAGPRSPIFEFFPWPPADLRALTLAHDLILVGGGNTANMLALWRVHGFDAVLREAWEQGIVLPGGAPG